MIVHIYHELYRKNKFENRRRIVPQCREMNRINFDGAGAGVLAKG